MAKEAYANQEFVGGAGQGINDKVHVRIGRTEITSDSITPEAAESLTAKAINQTAPEYEHAEEKQHQLNEIHIIEAVKTGAITGFALSTIDEICCVIKNKNSLTEDQFIESIQSILCGTVDGGIKGGAIMGSVQAMGKVLGREIPTNSLGAVPVMAVANTSVDFAKNLYRCFVTKEIDKDELLLYTVNNSFSSLGGYTGTWAGSQLAGLLVSHEATTAISAKIAVTIGASIGSSIGPLGTVIGSVIGSLIFGIGVNAIINTSYADAQKAFDECMRDIEAQVELEGVEQLYYFADSMAEISEFQFSFKSLLPCYNLISDLKGYVLHKQKIKEIQKILEEDNLSSLDMAYKKRIRQLKLAHQHRLAELTSELRRQRELMYREYRDAVETYISNSYMQYLEMYAVLSDNVDLLVESLQNNIGIHNQILSSIQNRKIANQEIDELMDNASDRSLVQPFLDKMKKYMQQDELIVNKQYISYSEAMYLVGGENIYE